MKLPRKSRQWLGEIEKAISKAYLQLERYDQPGKRQYEAVLSVVVTEVIRNRGVKPEKMGEKTGEMTEALSEYLKSLPEDQRAWSGIVTFLYVKYHQVLGLITEQQMLEILSQTPLTLP